MFSTLFAILPLLSVALSASAAPTCVTKPDEAAYPFDQPKFTSTTPEQLCLDSTVPLTFEGGSGYYDVYYFYKYPGQFRPAIIYGLRNVTETSYHWQIGSGPFPDDSTFSVGVQDANWQQYTDVAEGTFELLSGIPVGAC